MEIRLEKIGKRFTHAWIFRDISTTIHSGQRLAILGHNGSGKSTLLKILAGALAPSSGIIVYSENGKALDVSGIYQRLSFAAPYAELIEDFTLREAYHFHTAFKPLVNAMPFAGFRELLDFPFAPHMQIKHYSSGMKQRLKLGLVICSASDILILDEPGSNLDVRGKAWLQSLLRTFSHHRMVIIASNEPDDTTSCTSHLNLEDFKP